MSASRILRQRLVDARRRKGRQVENDQFAAAAGRILRAMCRRVSAGDVEDLRLLADLGRDVDQALVAAVRAQRARDDVSWSRIAQALGITKQAAQQRFARARRERAMDG